MFRRSPNRSVRRRPVRPVLEGLEGRLLLYSTLGGQWTYGSRITYSFMPDGTSIGGTPSALFQPLNAKYPTATWEGQIEQAASIWEAATNINLAQVSDGGEAVGSSGDQQDDPRFGDIRIGAIPLPAGTLAETFAPPPINGGTVAGDILFNSTVNWQIGSNYDLMTVAAHEFGHALGLGESTVSNTVMYGTYSGINEALASDDIAGIQSLYGTRQYDAFNSNGQRNDFYTTATNITAYLTSNAQIAIPRVDNTTTSDVEWYRVTVPSSTTGAMSVTVQSSNLSSLAPKLMVYNSSLGLVNSASASNTFGATITTKTAVTAGQSYYIRVQAAGGPGAVGGYGLLVNFGNQTQSAIAPPNTVVAAQPSQGTGAVTNAKLAPGSSPTNTAKVAPGSRPTNTRTDGLLGGLLGTVGGLLGAVGGLVGGLLGLTWTTVGDLSGWAVAYTTGSSSGSGPNAVVRASNPAPSVAVAGTSTPVLGANPLAMGALEGMLAPGSSNSPTTSSSGPGKTSHPISI